MDPVDDRFEDVDWSEIYGDINEDIPENMPKPRGNVVRLTMFCDAAFAGDKKTRRSHTGIIFIIQGAPIVWYSKKQATVEASTFGSEFVALRVACEMNDALRYKLRMMGIPLDGPTNGFCDNEGVVNNVSKAESTLKKKHLAVCYHKARESAAREAIRFAYEKTETNLADVCTKIQSQKRKEDKLERLLY